MLEINLKSSRGGQILANTFTLMVPDTEDWHGQELQIKFHGTPIGTARVLLSTPFYAEKLNDRSCLVATGMTKLQATSTYMTEFGSIAGNTRVAYLSIRWESRDLTNLEPIFNEQWFNVVQERETIIQTHYHE